MKTRSSTGRRSVRLPTTINSKDKPRLVLGYDLDRWNEYGERKPIAIDLSPQTNSHIILCGMSGSGKSYHESAILAKLALAEPEGEIYFADYKRDDSFEALRSCRRYYPYRDSIQALDIVHNRLMARQSGEDNSRNPVTLIWDEYMAQALNMLSEDKKAATAMMHKVSELLLLGRSLSVRIGISCQRPDALAFPAGSRLNYGVTVVLGAAVRSIYEMLLPDHMEQVKGRQFGRGEGVVLLHGSQLRFLKVPVIGNPERMNQICIKALGGTR